jgi:dipeptide transport system permease protein
MAKDYVMAAKLDGASPARLFTHSIFPNILSPLIVQISLAFSTAIIDIAALGFLGLGAQPPNPEWGTILSQSRDLIQLAPWVVTTPGLAILITVLSINLVGDGLRDALDPKENRS